MKNKKTILCLALFSCLTSCALFSESERLYRPKEGFVPDEKTAIRIAEAIWFPVYGEKRILNERPFYATLENGIWTVRGSLLKKYNYKGVGPPPRGGTAMAKIVKKDGRILGVIHEE